MPVKFEWDEAKDIAKHGISFAQAIGMFDGPVVSRADVRKDYGEVRMISYGVIEGAVVVAAVHTDRSGVTRIISARLASSRERKAYYASL